MRSETRIAFVLDALPSLGGSEKVLFTALEAYPAADVYALIYNLPLFAGTPIAGRHVRTSFLNRFPLARRHHRLLLPLMPAAIEHFDLRGYDVIVSFNYAVSHGILSQEGTRRLAYTYTPMRYAWTDVNLDGTHTPKNVITDRLMDAFRKWDVNAASRVHEFAAISKEVAHRIRKAWQREARLIYPPVEIERFRPEAQREDFYVTVSRLVPHKRLDLLVRAFSRLKLSLVVIGDGPQSGHLRSLSDSNIHFFGYASDATIADLLSRARGFVCAAEEDFGIAIVEAQAAGCPVIAYGRGGALETVHEGCTGMFFAEQSVESLIAAIEAFERNYDSFRPADAVDNARRFGRARFLREFQEFVGISR